MQKTCANCGSEFSPMRATAKTCSERCKKALQRRGGLTVIDVTPAGATPESEAPVVVALRAELVEAGVGESAEGELALMLAAMAADTSQPAAGRVAAAKEARAAKEAALASVKRADQMDEVTRRRDEKLRAARGA